MNKGDFKKFEQIMGGINEVYGDPSKQVSELKMDLYWNSLKDLTIDHLNRAVNMLMNTKVIKTFPLPAEIREAALGNLDDKAEAAFEVFWGTVQNLGAYQSVVFQDGIIGRVVTELGGWEKACHPEEESKWYRKTFCDLYKSFERRGVGHEPMKVLGIAEGYNEAHVGSFNKPIEQYQLGKPVVVGEQEKTLRLVR